MAVKLISDNQRKDWNDFLIKNNGHFLQSFEWGEIQKAQGKKVWRLAVMEGGEILAQAQIIKHSLALSKVFHKSFFYLPFGHCFKRSESRPLNLILQKMGELAKQENAVFLHLESFKNNEGLPFVESKYTKGRPSFSWVESDKDIQPKKTLLLDLTKTDEELLADCTASCRHNIRKARKIGAKVKFSDQYQPIFYDLMQKNAQHNKFKPFPESHYQNLFKFQSNCFKARMTLVEYQEKILAAYIVVFFNKTAVFLHGASDRAYNHIKTSNLREWEKIMLAKKMGCTIVDFWGIDEKKWPGFTYFKKTFKGKEHIWPQRYDVIFNKTWYWLYKCFKKALRKS